MYWKTSTKKERSVNLNYSIPSARYTGVASADSILQIRHQWFQPPILVIQLPEPPDSLAIYSLRLARHTGHFADPSRRVNQGMDYPAVLLHA